MFEDFVSIECLDARKIPPCQKLTNFVVVVSDPDMFLLMYESNRNKKINLNSQMGDTIFLLIDHIKDYLM